MSGARGKLGSKSYGNNDSKISNNHNINESINHSINPSKEDRKGMTLRLHPEAWKQLKQLALDEGVTSHNLLIKAVNDMFEKHGKQPIA